MWWPCPWLTLAVYTSPVYNAVRLFLPTSNELQIAFTCHFTCQNGLKMFPDQLLSTQVGGKDVFIWLRFLNQTEDGFRGKCIKTVFLKMWFVANVLCTQLHKPAVWVHCRVIRSDNADLEACSLTFRLRNKGSFNIAALPYKGVVHPSHTHFQ